jgi:hypothetical protein
VTYWFSSYRLATCSRFGVKNIKYLDPIEMVHAPRASTFLRVEESTAILWLFFQIFGNADRGNYSGSDYRGDYD